MFVVMVEGDTERALRRHLKSFIDQRALAEGKPRPRLTFKPNMTYEPAALRRHLAYEFRRGAQAVVGLIDVYPNFQSAADAKTSLTRAADDARFIPHAAQYDVEAWLLPYWSDICQRISVRQQRPGAHPEEINGQKPPAYHLRELYQRARPHRKYNKVIEMDQLLEGKDLTLSAAACPEFKALLNTLLTLSGLTPLP